MANRKLPGARLKVMTILGTRPEIIRLSRVIKLLDQYAEHTIVHTGQNWDYELNEAFFDDLDVRKPDYFLGVGGGSLGEVLGGILQRIEKILVREAPDAVLILGDTNSSIAAIMVRRLKIPIYHMEAGNRSFDRNVPEETNRRLVDHISDFNLVYTEHARRHLISEGIEHRRIVLTGSPMFEVLSYYREKIDQSDVLRRLELSPQGYFVVSAHREENVDNPERLRELVAGINLVAEKYNSPVVISTHPRTRQRLNSLGLDFDSRVRDLKPFGFHDYNKLQINASCVISDSGTISEESAILNFPAVTPRDAIERPESLDSGAVIVTGVNALNILAGVDAAIQMRAARMASGIESSVAPFEYLICDTSYRVVSLIVGTARLSNDWDGIRTFKVI